MRTKKTILRRMTAAGLMLASALLLIIAGCKGNLGRTQTKASENSTWYKDTAALEALYQKAVDDASEPTPSKVVDTLVSITNASDNPDQEWIKVGDTDMVLVASLMKQKFVDMYRNEPDTFRRLSRGSPYLLSGRKRLNASPKWTLWRAAPDCFRCWDCPLARYIRRLWPSMWMQRRCSARRTTLRLPTIHRSCPILRECRRTIMTGSSTTSRSLTSQEMLTLGHSLAIHTTGITPMDLTSASASL